MNRERRSFDQFFADLVWWMDKKERTEMSFSILLMLVRGVVIAGIFELFARMNFMATGERFNLVRFFGLAVLFGSTTEIIRVLEQRKRKSKV